MKYVARNVFGVTNSSATGGGTFGSAGPEHEILKNIQQTGSLQ